MKKLILETILLIIIPVISLLGVGEYALRKIPNDYSYKNKWMIENSSNTKILILGSSHTYYGINPKYFDDKAFNCAHVSQSPKYDFLIFNKFINRMDSVRFIILPLSYFSVYSRLEDGDEKWRSNNYYLYYDFENKKLAIDERYLIFNKSPKRWNRAVKSLLGRENEIDCDKLGYGLSYSTHNKKKDWESTGKEAAKRHTKETDLTIIEENKNYIEAIVRKCKTRNIKVILLTTPTWHTYRENLNINQWKITTDFCKQMSSKYSNIIYLNFLADKNFESKDFYDADHLNEVGAKKLTLILNDTIMKSNQRYGQYNERHKILTTKH